MESLHRPHEGSLISQASGLKSENDDDAHLALVYARTGETDEAITMIEHLLTVPAQFWRYWSITLTELKWRWEWDPLRSHPRFKKILEGPEPKTEY